MKEKKKAVFGTREWAAKSANAAIGCSHNCLYCYARDAYNKKDKSGIDWTVERDDPKRISHNWRKESGTVMFPTTHDITPNTLKASLKVLRSLLLAGNDVLIVSKPHVECIESICNEFDKYKENILFRFTIGSTKDDVLSFWEPGAPSYKERFESLKLARQKGFYTSVSAEPLLDNNPKDVKVLVDSLSPFITGAIWLGKMNYPEKRVSGVSKEILDKYLKGQTDENVLVIYEMFKDHPLIKWKESIKAIIGEEIPTKPGLDI